MRGDEQSSEAELNCRPQAGSLRSDRRRRGRSRRLGLGKLRAGEAGSTTKREGQARGRTVDKGQRQWTYSGEREREGRAEEGGERERPTRWPLLLSSAAAGSSPSSLSLLPCLAPLSSQLSALRSPASPLPPSLLLLSLHARHCSHSSWPHIAWSALHERTTVENTFDPVVTPLSLPSNPRLSPLFPSHARVHPTPSHLSTSPLPTPLSTPPCRTLSSVLRCS